MDAPAPSVLVVDDDLSFLGFATELLRPVCRAVYVARAPLTALRALQSEAIDVVVCDLRLANADGRELLNVIRSEWPHVARVLVTGYPARVVEPDTFPAAQAVVFKPIDGDSLVDLIRRLGAIPAAHVADVDVAQLACPADQSAPIVTDPNLLGRDDGDPVT